MKNIKNKITNRVIDAQIVLNHKRRGEFAADKGIVIAITVAVAALALALTFGILKDTIAPNLTKAIEGFFSFK